MKKAILALLLAAVVPFVVFASNPFLTGSEGKKEKSVSLPGSSLIKKIAAIQARLNRKISDQIKSYREKGTAGVFAAICAAMLAYGAVHALGPGHGKAVLSAWVLASRKRVRRVIAAGVLSAFFHAMSAMALVAVSFIIIKKTVGAEADFIREIMQFAAGLVLFFVGIAVLKGVFMPGKKENHEPEKKHGPLAISAGIGLVPCPSTTVILVFSFSFGLIAEGIIFALFFAAGMALTQTAIALGVWHLGERAVVSGKTAGFVISRVVPAISGVILLAAAVFVASPFIAGTARF